ncbi:MAG: DUF2169 domain-containing protein [Polyangiaceae bacterium]
MRVEATTDRFVSASGFLWRSRAGLHLTAIAKAVFQIAPNATATWVSPGEVFVEDRHFGAKANASVERASDLVPYRPRCDVTFVGAARSATPVPQVVVRVGLSRDNRILLNKVVLVVGDRAHDGSVRPFTELAVVYERASAGPQNPVGSATPNVFDPADPRRPIGLGPVGQDWPSRRAQLGALDPRSFAGELPSFPEDTPWGYFQSAPPDQQIEHLSGGEQLLLDGVHATAPRIVTQLPAARGEARVLSAHPQIQFDQRIALVCDSLAIDAYAGTLALTWRGSTPIPQSLDPARIRLFAALSPPGVMALGTSVDPQSAATKPQNKKPDGDSTVALDSKSAILAMARGAAMPFAGAANPKPTTGPSALPQSLPWAASAEKVVPARSGDETLTTSPIAAPRATDETLTASPFASGVALPFAQSGGAQPPRAAQSNQGLPWGGAPAAVTQPARPGDGTLTVESTQGGPTHKANDDLADRLRQAGCSSSEVANLLGALFPKQK